MQTKQQTLTSQLNENSMVKQVRTYQKQFYVHCARRRSRSSNIVSTCSLFSSQLINFFHTYLEFTGDGSLNEDSKVYKLVGPVLAAQDFVMAKDNVEALNTSKDRKSGRGISKSKEAG